LLLARLFARPANLLVLDEPTNDLDIDTLELLESLLQDYPGTVLLVSHDRAFLDNVVTQSICFAGGGQLVEIAGGYDDWLRYRAVQAEAAPRKQVAETATPRPAAKAEKPAKARLSFKEARELEGLPARIEALEVEQAQLNERLADPDLYRQQSEAVAGLKQRLDEIETELLALLERWEALEAIGTG
jgi:ATP-binding cassette subfamily F protein uup